jgi:hypothetical protein
MSALVPFIRLTSSEGEWVAGNRVGTTPETAAESNTKPLGIVERCRSPAMAKLAAVAVAAFLAIAPNAARAQVFYTVNGQPAPPNLSQFMAANGLPFGNYWLHQNGDWGVVGSMYPLGNINANPGYPNPRNSGGQGTRCRTWGTGQMRCD